MIKFWEEVGLIIRRRDFTAKTICLLAATALWAYVGSTQIAELDFKVPLEFRNLPANLVLAHRPARSVTVTASGRNEDVKLVSARNFKAYISMENASPGENAQYRVDFIKTDIPENVRIDVNPKKLLLSVAERSYKKVRVAPRITGRVQEGYVLGTVKAFPEYVTVSGPRSMLDGIGSVPTRRVSVEALSQKAAREIPLDIESLGQVNVDVLKVTLFIPVLEAAGMSRVEVKLRLKGTSEKYLYSLADEAAVIYLKQLQENAELAPGDIEALVDPSAAGMENQLAAGNDTEIERFIPVVPVIKNRAKRDMFRPIIIVPDAVAVKVSKKSAP